MEGFETYTLRILFAIVLTTTISFAIPVPYDSDFKESIYEHYDPFDIRHTRGIDTLRGTTFGESKRFDNSFDNWQKLQRHTKRRIDSLTGGAFGVAKRFDPRKSLFDDVTNNSLRKRAGIDSLTGISFGTAKRSDPLSYGEFLGKDIKEMQFAREMNDNMKNKYENPFESYTLNDIYKQLIDHSRKKDGFRNNGYNYLEDISN